MLTAVLGLTTGLTSCKDNDVDESGTANIKVVNAAPSSASQNLFIADKSVATGLDFGEASNYIAFSSGNNLQAEFRTESSGAVYASGDFDLDNGSNYTVFLAGDGAQARVNIFKDDNSPVSGKAKVRFIHLSDGAPTQIDVRNGATTNLAVNIGRNTSSNYVNLDPGVLSLQVFATGGSTSIGTFDLTALQADKVYTIYITGTSADAISVRQTTHN